MKAILDVVANFSTALGIVLLARILLRTRIPSGVP
jgi:hypothetical protein